jgi:hypothetical protein
MPSHEQRVDLLGRCAAGLELARLRQLRVDDLDEPIVALRAPEQHAVDQEGRSTGDAELLRKLGVGLHLVCENLVGAPGAKLPCVHAHLTGPAHEIVEAQVPTIGLRQPDELPECVAAAERVHHRARLGCRPGLLVKGQRQMLPDDTDLVPTVLGLDLVERV